jgi:hypothetical protein
MLLILQARKGDAVLEQLEFAARRADDLDLGKAIDDLWRLWGDDVEIVALTGLKAEAVSFNEMAQAFGIMLTEPPTGPPPYEIEILPPS